MKPVRRSELSQFRTRLASAISTAISNTFEEEIVHPDTSAELRAVLAAVHAADERSRVAKTTGHAIALAIIAKVGITNE